MYTKHNRTHMSMSHIICRPWRTDGALGDTSSHVGVSRGTARWWLLEFSGTHQT